MKRFLLLVICLASVELCLAQDNDTPEAIQKAINKVREEERVRRNAIGKKLEASEAERARTEARNSRLEAELNALKRKSAAPAPPVVAMQVAASPTVAVAGSRFQDDLTGGGKGPWMVIIPAGRFQIGSEEISDEKGGKVVTLGQSLAVGQYEVTVGEYLGCVQAGGCDEPAWREAGSRYHYQTGLDNLYRKLGASFTGERYPVVGVSWRDAVRYVTWLNKVKLKEPGRYKLLSESEWEYAARGGNPGKWSFGDDEQLLVKYAWYWKNSDGRTHEVGTLASNKYGLNDMHGNVWEWVQDCYHGNFQGLPQDGTAWETACETERRVIRGGSWDIGPVDTRAANRFSISPANRVNYVGFRVARTLP